MNGIQGCGLRSKPMRGEQNFSSQALKVQAPASHPCVWQQASKQPLHVCSTAGAASGGKATAMTAIQAIRGSGRCDGMK